MEYITCVTATMRCKFFCRLHRPKGKYVSVGEEKKKPLCDYVTIKRQTSIADRACPPVHKLLVLISEMQKKQMFVPVAGISLAKWQWSGVGRVCVGGVQGQISLSSANESRLFRRDDKRE